MRVNQYHPNRKPAAPKNYSFTFAEIRFLYNRFNGVEFPNDLPFQTALVELCKTHTQKELRDLADTFDVEHWKHTSEYRTK